MLHVSVITDRLEALNTWCGKSATYLIAENHRGHLQSTPKGMNFEIQKLKRISVLDKRSVHNLE
jgi:hypothetical protein